MNPTIDTRNDETSVAAIQVLDDSDIDAVGGGLGPLALVVIAVAGGAAAGAAGAAAINKFAEWWVYG